MGKDLGEDEQVLSYSCDAKLHSLMCKKLAKFVDRITWIFPAIESARPGCISGIQTLCVLNRAIEKAKLLLQHCADSSKLYLAITGETVQLRFERVQNDLDLSLSKIQTMVQQPLAAQVLDIVNDLQDVKFIMESSEEEAGRLLIALLQQDGSSTDSAETSEFQVFHSAALKLDITSCKALLIEKRLIKKLLDKVHHTNQRKESILKYLLYLIRKYGRFAGSEHTENVDDRWKCSRTSTKSAFNDGLCENQAKHSEPRLHMGSVYSEAQMNISGPETPPEEFICPISLKLMFDPVVIASGKTCERTWVEKWFNEGHDTCPKTLKQLSHLSMTPNSCLKDLISKWCRKHSIIILDPSSQPIPAAFSSWNMSDSSSIDSLSNSLNGMPTLLHGSTTDYITESDTSSLSISSDASNCLDSYHLKSIESLKYSQTQIFSWNDDSGNGSCQSFADFSHEMYLNFFSKLALLPIESQFKAVEDVKIFLKDNDGAYYSMHSNGFVEALMRFLLDACVLSNINAQRTGLQILSAFVTNSRGEIPLQETEFDLLASFIDSKLSEEALAIMQMLSSQQCCRPKIMASSALPSVIKILDSQVKEYVTQAVEILSDLSSEGGVESCILQSGCISKLVQLLGVDKLAGNCIKILQNLCETEQSIVAIAETNGCIASIAELLDTGTSDDQGYAAAILLSLCSYNLDYCRLVMNEGVIPSLVHISINGNIQGKESAAKLLHLLRDLRHDDPPDSSLTQAESDSKLSQDFGKCCKEKQPSFKAASFFKRKISFLSKHRSLALF